MPRLCVAAVIASTLCFSSEAAKAASARAAAKAASARASLTAPAPLRGGGACTTSFNCSLNGQCTAGACVCDPPWGGDSCQTLIYATTPASGQNLWSGPFTDPNLNTWNGPIVTGADGTYHLFDPVYEHASLWNVIYYAHGVASKPEGPYDWSLPNISSNAINPAALVFPDATTGDLVYTLWIGNDILVASSVAGPYTKTYSNPAPSNSAPAFWKGTFYVTDQDTSRVLSATSLKGPWTTFSTITHPSMPYTVEDPFMYFNARGEIHIINHAYNTGQRTNCTTSWVSSHFFSADGVTWGHTDQPYGHTVVFDDGTSHSYCTLERPNLLFDATGLLTHIHFAADLVTEDAGCPNRGKGCVDCKYDDHAGTLLVKLGA